MYVLISFCLRAFTLYACAHSSEWYYLGSEHLGWITRPSACVIPLSMPVRILQSGVILQSGFQVLQNDAELLVLRRQSNKTNFDMAYRTRWIKPGCLNDPRPRVLSERAYFLKKHSWIGLTNLEHARKDLTGPEPGRNLC
jgi:hypothetical protein